MEIKFSIDDSIISVPVGDQNDSIWDLALIALARSGAKYALSECNIFIDSVPYTEPTARKVMAAQFDSTLVVKILPMPYIDKKKPIRHSILWYLVLFLFFTAIAMTVWYKWEQVMPVEDVKVLTTEGDTVELKDVPVLPKDSTNGDN